MAELTAPLAGASRRAGSPWLFSARLDLLVFGGSALLSFLLLGWGAATGLLDETLPAWTWVATVLAVDVAHVWSTAWRVYLDPQELARRPALYIGVPLLGWVAGVVLHSASSGWFWRVLAYMAVYHFVRQQYGWVALYRRRLGAPPSRLGRVLDDAAIYSSTLYPLLWWHAHLPREFSWFLDGDFLPGIPTAAATVLLPVHVVIMVAWAGHEIWQWWTGRPVSAGKALVIVTTWLAWFVGIVVFDSDYAFTVTNVLIHGIPYLALTWVYGKGRFVSSGGWRASVFKPSGWWLFLLPLVAVAYVEEWAWDRLVWHEHGGLFAGPEVLLSSGVTSLIVPLLVMPQLTHYLLDGFIWRREGNPGLAETLGLTRRD